MCGSPVWVNDSFHGFLRAVGLVTKGVWDSRVEQSTLGMLGFLSLCCGTWAKCDLLVLIPWPCARTVETLNAAQAPICPAALGAPLTSCQSSQGVQGHVQGGLDDLSSPTGDCVNRLQVMAVLSV